jgi:hypothetical protein
MTTGVSLIKSTPVTPPMLISSNVPENDYGVWAAGTTYSLGQRVIVLAEHKVYESLQAGNVGHAPATSATWWIEVGATNRWKPFDLSNTTQMTNGSDVVYEIKPGVACSAVCLLNMSGVLSVRIIMTDPTFGVMYDKTTGMISIPAASTWYDWFFGVREQQTQFIAQDLPSFPNAVIRLEITGTPVIGVIMIGQVKTIGFGVQHGVRVGIKDYSVKTRNQWGDTILKQGAYAKRASFTLKLSNRELDYVYNTLAAVRATPCLWIGFEAYACTIVFGFYTEFEIAIPYPNESDCTLDIEGLT